MSWNRLLASLAFYPKVGLAIFKAGRKGKRNQLNPTAIAAFGAEVKRGLESVGVRFDVTGLDNISDKGPVVYISNHMSVLETLVLPALLPCYPPLTFVIKRSLLGYPFFGHIIASLDPIVVTRENPRSDLATVLVEGVKRLQEGKSVVIFPQAARSMEFDAANFSSLGVKLAQRAGVPIVPVALKTDAWGIGHYLRDIGWIDPSRKVRFAFGKLILAAKGDRQVNDEVAGFIKAKTDEWAIPGPIATASLATEKHGP